MIELLVVIGIIGILSGIMLVTFSGSTESARAAQCLSNMRNLSAACQTYASVHGRYPFAGSIEYMTINEDQGIARAKAVYHEMPGWISWASGNAYPRGGADSHKASEAWMTSTYSTENEQNLYCLTNGALWKYVSGNHQTYICQDHMKKHPNNPPQWSYVMNAFFGWDTSRGGSAQGQNFGHVRYGDLDRADRYLLFAEMQFLPCGLPIAEGDGSGSDCDCVLQYDVGAVKNGSYGANSAEGTGSESIGVNHKNGRNLYAHVTFADGHAEKLRIPYSGSIKNPQVDESALRSLTAWLCSGEDVSFDGKRYERMEN